MQRQPQRRRPVGRLVPALLVLVTWLSACTTQASLDARPTRQSLPPQGIYEGCVPHEAPSCLDHLTQISQAGFKLVLNYDVLFFTEAELRAYAARAQALELQIIWAMNNPVLWDGADLRSHFSRLAATCGCSNNRGFIRYVVGLERHLPATWGYYVGDEVPVRDHAKVKTYSQLIHHLDPTHPRLFVGIGNPDGSNLAPFGDTTDVLGADYYPISDPGASISQISDVARVTQSLSDHSGEQSAMVLQAFSWAEYPKEYWSCSPFPACARFPTRDEMRQMRDVVLKDSHPSMLLWYSYFDIRHSPNPSAHWADLVAAAGVTAAP